MNKNKMKKEKFTFKEKVEKISSIEIKEQQEEIKRLKMPNIRTMDFLYEDDKESEVAYEYPELIALCPMTGIPDIYTVRIIYTPNKKVPELKSLRFYFLAYKDIPILHEHLANKISEDFKKAVNPRKLRIELDVAVRGGIRTKIIKGGIYKMNYITPAKMREIDKRTQDEFAIPVTILMENAGRAVFQAAMEMLSGKENKKVVVVSGSGSNGGDSLVAARHLMNNGIETDIFSGVPIEKLYGEAKAN